MTVSALGGIFNILLIIIITISSLCSCGLRRTEVRNLYCSVFRSQLIGIWPFRQRTPLVWHGPRINKFMLVILRLIKKTFAKWWNKCKFSEKLKIEIWIVPYGKHVENVDELNIRT